MKKGFVYIFHRADGLRKLGWTTSVSRRQSEHHIATGLAHDFEMAWEMGSRAAHRVEQIAHRLLNGLSCAWSREVYDLPLAPIVDAVQRATKRTETELPGGLAACFLPRPRGSYPSLSIRRPDNLDELIAEANAYLLEHPGLQQEIADYAETAARQLGIKSEAGFTRRLAKALANAAKGKRSDYQPGRHSSDPSQAKGI